MTDLVLDSNALTLWVDKHPEVLALLEAAQRVNGVVHVPTVCLVESLTGGPRDAPLNQRLKGTRAAELGERLARVAAQLRAAMDGDDVADPVVVATVAALGATVLSTENDISVLATHATPRVRVVDPQS